MFLSVSDIFKIGIGPSSSHTVGPMIAAGRFLSLIGEAKDVRRLKIQLHGSLAFTGKGHGTDIAVQLGLCGAKPDSVDPDQIDGLLSGLREAGCLASVGLPDIEFQVDRDLVFDMGPPLEVHTNGMTMTALDGAGSELFAEEYYSVGGGFVVSAAELAQPQWGVNTQGAALAPYPFATADQMLALGREHQLSIAEMKQANEVTINPEVEIEPLLDQIWGAMSGCMERGLGETGVLPGGLAIKRRAADIYAQLLAEADSNALQPHRSMDWLSVYAMAVNEENASGGRVVTAPTNGAAGVIPAVIKYYEEHCLDGQSIGVRTFLLTASAIGGIIKHNASISGAEVGCQGEVGSASAMAAAGLVAALGGSNEQVENAAEIALEHHLGMTCDPIGGLVQVPCIERNAFGAVKAVTAASMALRGDGQHFVSLDRCIETMRQTGLDMSEKYKETSTGGLAVNVVAC